VVGVFVKLNSTASDGRAENLCTVVGGYGGRRARAGEGPGLGVDFWVWGTYYDTAWHGLAGRNKDWVEPALGTVLRVQGLSLKP
jgi:hypothetical protein